MNRHPFDVFSAVLGVLAIAAGALAASGTVDPFAGSEAGIWITIAALAIGVLLLPWGRWPRPATEVDDSREELRGTVDAHDEPVEPIDLDR